MSLFFAFATLFPDYEIRLFFILPVKVKWLALLSGAFSLFELVGGGTGTRARSWVAFANYLLFFGGHLAALQGPAHARASGGATRRAGPSATSGRRTHARCAICGAKQDDGADIRVCSCEKCGGVPRQLCLEHARNH